MYRKSIFTSYFILALTLCTNSLWAQEKDVLMQEVENKLYMREYAKAFRLLHHADSLNLNPKIVLKKHEIASQFFIHNEKYVKFSFIDIDPTKIIEDYRGKAYSDKYYDLPFHEIYTKLIQKYPSQINLKAALIEYYFQSYMSYGNDWVIPADTVFVYINKGVQELASIKKAEARQYFILGYTLLAQQRTKEAIIYLNKAYLTDSKNGELNFNLGAAYEQIYDADSSLKYYKNAIAYYEDSVNKSEAAFKVGYIYEANNKKDYALTYYKMSYKISNNNYYAIRSILKYLVAENRNGSNEMLAALFYLVPESTMLYNDLYDIYYFANRLNDLRDFYIAQLEIFKEKNRVMGHLYFYLSQIEKEKNKEKALDYLKRAKFFYLTYLPNSHPIMKVVETAMKELSE